MLGLVKQWLDWEPGTRLAIVTRGATSAARGDVADLAGAAVWGLVRSAQSEQPGRLVLADLPQGRPGDGVVPSADVGALVASLAAEAAEPEVAVRDGQAYGRRLARPDAGGLARPSGGVPWRLVHNGRGTLEDGLVLVEHLQAAAPLEAGQVRVAVRAAGLNFRDVAVSLGLLSLPEAPIGSDIAGVVLETGPGVTGLAAGDRVLGMAESGFGPLTVTDARLLVPVPAGWSFAQAAAVPAVFATAWYALVDLAGARPGQRLVVHAATGGVGMAAVAIGRHLGLEVFGTASPAKHPVLAAWAWTPRTSPPPATSGSRTRSAPPLAGRERTSC